MMPIQLAGKYRTSLVGIAAYRNDRLHVLLEELIHVLGMMFGNIDADFLHHLNRERMNITGWLRPGTLYMQNIARRRAQEPFRQMTATRISRAKD